MEINLVSVVGLGKLGSPLAAVLAHKGFDVIGVDVNQLFVNAIQEGRAPVQEPLLQALIDGRKGSLTATLDYEAAVLGSDATFVIVPTPSDPDGFFSNKLVIAAVEEIGAALRQKADYHLVVISSTVMPGSTGGVIRQALERASGRTVGRGLGLCYNPEFIALGSAIRDMLWPDFILIGESDRTAGQLLSEMYRRVCDNDPPMRRMNFVNAEISKISVNTFVTTKISYANMLGELCDHLPEADVDVVTQAIGSDSRIGTKYLKGAIGYGGPCFPRDNKAFVSLCRNLGVRCDLAKATDSINDYQVTRLRNAVASRLQSGGRVGILGLAYKPDTDVIEESQGVQLAHILAEEGYEVVVFDPLALGSASAVLGERVTVAQSAEACLHGADAVVIATPWPEFAKLSDGPLSSDGGPLFVLDPWCVLPLEGINPDIKVVRLGRGTDGREPAAAPAAAASG